MRPRQRTAVLALAAACLFLGSAAPAAFASFGLRPGGEGLNFFATQEGGAAAVQAGSHPQTGRTELNFSGGDVKDFELELPPGLVENPAAVPKCSQAAFATPRSSPFESSLSGEDCPDASQVGVVEVRSSNGGGTVRSFGVFNLAPPAGAPSELGFSPFGSPITFISHVRQADGEYGLSLAAAEIPQSLHLTGLTLTIWGNPWGLAHNAQRGNCLNELEPGFGWAKCSVGSPRNFPPVAYLTLPTACEEPPAFAVFADSWQEPSSRQSRTFDAQTLQGCNQLVFEPHPSATLSDPRAASPSGYDFSLDVDNSGFLDPTRLAPSPAKRAVVALPDGMTINPSVGAGLSSCGPAQYAAETAFSAPGVGCPNPSKIGDFSVTSPLFEKPLEGSLFLATPHQNPFGTLLAIYLVAKLPARGVLVKVAGRLDPDPASGRIVATFDNLPQLPYANLRVHFREGQRSPLATPQLCGSVATTIDLSPWRSGAASHTVSPATIAAGPGGGPCPPAQASFDPGSVAGSLNSNAGSYSPFYLHLTRTDTQQEITSYSATLPPGLTGKIGSIPYCSDAAIEAAKSRGGFEEIANPSCPAASEIGHTNSGFGLGPVLSYAPGGLYLAGPFHGSTFSIVAIDAATVGPFDLGVIVVRSAIKVDPQTAQVSIDSAGSDPIPHIIQGVPIHLRDVRVYISRPGFTLNPTSCEPFSVASSLNGSGQRFSDPGDDETATVTNLFQVFNCESLDFKPKLSFKLKGGTKRGSYPSLRAELKPRLGDANIGSATVTLPPSEFLEQGHIDTICTRAQFAREACPAGSVYGHARAFTPLLDQPLEGNVYLRASDNKLPDLVAALRGGGKGIAIDVSGRIDSFHGGLRATYSVLPDAPVSKFVMTLRGGKRGLLVNSENLCKATAPANARLVGKNNLGEKLRPRLAIKCGKKGKRGSNSGGGKGAAR
jgi:hypothetical protein